jgi:hypothetical protein
VECVYNDSEIINKGDKGMKRKIVFLIAAFVIAAIVAYAAAPTSKNYYNALGSAFTVDNAFDGSAGCDIVDSCVYIASDSANCIVTVTGIAIMSPGDKLYMGLGNDSSDMVSPTSLIANNNLKIDTVIYPKAARGRINLPFVFRTIIASPASATTDTLYFNAGVGGTSNASIVYLRNLLITVSVAGVE